MADDARCDYAAEFDQLRQRFLRIAQYGAGDADVMAATAYGGELVYRATVAGFLPAEIPAPEKSTRPSDDRSPYFSLCWDAALSIYFSQMNPARVHWEERESPDAESVRVGRTKKSDWRIRAENYATTCSDFVKMLGPTAEAPVPVVERSSQGDFITWQNTRYPVTDCWADAFDAMLAAEGQPVGITKYVHHTKTAIEKLKKDAPPLADLLQNAGTKGYRLRAFD